MNCGLLAETVSPQQLSSVDKVEIDKKAETMQLLYKVIQTWEAKAPALRVSKDRRDEILRKSSRSQSPERTSQDKKSMRKEFDVANLFKKSSIAQEQQPLKKNGKAPKKEEIEDLFRKWKSPASKVDKGSFGVRKESEGDGMRFISLLH